MTNLNSRSALTSGQLYGLDIRAAAIGAGVGNPRPVATRAELEVLNAIVRAIAIDVMNRFVGLKVATQRPTHLKAMLKLSLLPTVHLAVSSNVSRLLNSPSAPLPSWSRNSHRRIHVASVAPAASMHRAKPRGVVGAITFGPGAKLWRSGANWGIEIVAKAQPHVVGFAKLLSLDAPVAVLDPANLIHASSVARRCTV